MPNQKCKEFFDYLLHVGPNRGSRNFGCRPLVSVRYLERRALQDRGASAGDEGD